mmetsp:Transcript_24075/g.29650  ORF Transcript_24075/g.29650 Transcript_24075/m.29650 type:complete len:356 (-) Transcript_24075:2169-3236(-)
MGRVAKYKKIKAFDRNNSGGEYVWGSMDARTLKKKKRSKTAERLHEKKLKRKQTKNNDRIEDGGFDLPSQHKDDFNLSDFKVKKEKRRRLDDDLIVSSRGLTSTLTPTQSVLEQKPSALITNDKVKIGNNVVTCSIPQNDREERSIAKMLNIDIKTGNVIKQKNSSVATNGRKMIQGRKEGESMRSFNKRLKEETQMALAEDFKKSSRKNTNNQPGKEECADKAERRKEFMKKKKLKKKGASIAYSHQVYDQDIQRDKIKHARNELEIYQEDETEASVPSFLDQVEQPPIFNLLPRGAQKKAKLKNRGKDDNHCKNMDEKLIKAEQNAMEIMRRKVQAQYALIKAQRRKEGSFHF